MAGFEPTPAQRQAINDRQQNILVSASAGSGKTAVLVNRTIELIKEGQSIDRMLLVTFTEAAAKNMRDKIRSALQAIVQDSTQPKSLRDRMSNQINRLAAADISTIHAFCLKLIKRYYYLLDLDPQFRLLTDDTERLLLQEDVWHEVSEELYAHADDRVTGRASFAELVLNFSSDRDDQGLDDLVLRLYEIANAQPDPDQWLKKLPDNYELGEGPLLETAFFLRQVKPLVQEKLQQISRDYQDLVQRAEAEGLDKSATVLRQDQAVISQAESALFGVNVQDICHRMAQQKFGPFRGRPGAEDERLPLFKQVQQQRNQLKKQWELIVSDCLGMIDQSEEAVKEKLISEVGGMAEKVAALIKQAQTGDLAEKTIASLRQDLKLVAEPLELLQPLDWDKLRGIFVNAKFPRMSGKPKEDQAAIDAYESISQARTALKKQFDQVVSRYFAYDEAQLRKVSAKAQGILAELSAVTVAFRHQYQQTKLNRHVLEFSDLEHFAYQILTPPADQPNWQSLVCDLQQHYQEIMIDEYQDTNRLQESILMRLTTPERKNLFMVGDVKQSIYRFREADPTLFLGKYERYRHGKDGEAIVLGENFRSMTSVTSFTNVLFEQLMDQKVGEIAYDSDAHLKYAATYYEDNPDNQIQPTELLLYDANANREEDHEHEDDKLAGEMRMIGLRIKQMVENQELIYHQDDGLMHPIQYGDIVLLERTKAINNTLMEEFNKLNIPLTVHDVESYFQTTEVRVMMALLKIIDNPQQDIPLAAVLRSPVVGLSNQELAFIRLQNRAADYYLAVQSFMQRYQHHTLRHQSLFTTDQADQLYFKLDRFLDQLQTFRQTAQQQPLVELIWQIYDLTGYLDYVGAMPGGHQRQANLHALYQRAHTYEQTSFKGLYQFIRFIEKMQEHDKDLGVAPAQLTANTVNVMTIHGSKGLQFPVVFVIDTTHGFNQGASRENAVVDAVAGVGIRYLDDQRVVYDTPQRQAVIEEVQRGERAEDLRVLYVALTRAEQRLILTGSFNEERRTQSLASSWTRWQKAHQSQTMVLSPQPRISANSFMDWVGLALSRYSQFNAQQLSPDGVVLEDSLQTTTAKLSPAPDFLARTYTAETVSAGLQALHDHPDPAAEPEQSVGEGVGDDQIAHILGYQYPYQVATNTTAYQSVTDVKRVFEDPDNREMARWDYDRQRKVKTQGMYLNQDFAAPAFIQQADSQPAATEIGTATHLVLQKLPLDQGPIDLAAVENEIQHLVQAKLIAPPLASRINREGIVAFFKTAVGQQVLAQPGDYQREVPFSMIMNGHELFQGVDAADDERILIHGIIDGYLKTSAGIILVDYKTDHLDRSLAAAEQTRIMDRYRGQLELYKEALTMMEGVPVVQMGLYLVELGEFIYLTKEGD